MAFARPFAYNTGATIPGTEQLGSLSIGYPTSGFTNNPQYWNGPDEELGYVIAMPVPDNSQPTPLSGVTASVGFFRTEDFTDESFITLSETIAQQSFATSNDAKTWLNNNGYWTSFVSVTPTPTSTLSITPTPTPSVTATLTPTPTPTSGVTGDGWLFYYPEGPISVGPPINDGNAIFLSNPGTIGVYNPNYTGGTLELYFNENNSAGTSYLTQFQGLDTSGGTLTISQGSNTVIYSGSPAQYNLALPDGFLVLQVSNLTQMIQSASTPFVSGTTINVVVN